MLEFTIPGEPTAKGRPRMTTIGGKPRAFTPQKTRDAEETLKARAMEFRPAEPFDGPIHLDVIFVLPVPKSWPKWKTEAAIDGSLRHTKKPDRDNLLKLLKDAFNGVFWLDDSQVDVGTCRKMYGAQPRTWVRLDPAEPLTKDAWATLKRDREQRGGPSA